MKRFNWILPLALLSAFSCGKESENAPAEPQPVTISGYWAVAATDNGGGMTRKDVKELLDFGGDGTYTLLNSGSAFDFSDGILDAYSTDFSPSGQRFSCTYEGDVYHIESLGAELTASRISSTGFTFESASGERIRLEKVLYFKGEAPDRNDDSAFRINGSLIYEGNDLVGLITDVESGRGIPGVVVSDGYNCTRTDENGVYQFKSTEGLTRIVYYSTPADYQVTLESNSSSIPRFYTPVVFAGDLPFSRNDFLLTPLPGGKEEKWTFVAVGDPQCSGSGDATRYENETLVDMTSFLAGYDNVYCMTMGDIIFDSNNVWNRMHNNMGGFKVNGKNTPFFQVMGNHDKDATNNNDAYQADQRYIDQFGPVDYSYDRGDIHIIAMDNVRVSSITTSTHSNNYTWNYSYGFTDEQIEWLRQDLSYVEDKADKGVFLCVHIPFTTSRTDKNYDKVLELLKDFKEVHLMVGHTHYHRNIIHSSRIAKGGQPFYEHIHGAACGAWWSENSETGKNANVTTTGGYAGYTVYEVDGPSIVDRVLKGTNRPPTAQMRVYDSEFMFPGTRSFIWSSLTNTGGSSGILCPGNETLKDCWIAEVFDDDHANWTVELWQNGSKIGDFIRMGDSATSNIAICAYFFNQCHKNTSAYSKTTCAHIWYLKAPGYVPLETRDWEVRATFTHPVSNKVHVYTVNSLTTDYSDFDL